MELSVALIQDLFEAADTGLVNWSRENIRHALQTDNEAQLLEMSALLDHSSQEFDDCRRKLETSMLFAPLRPASWCALADAYFLTELTEDARNIYSYVANSPNSSTTLVRYCAWRLDMMGESARALEAARRVVAEQGEHAQTFYEFSYFLARSGSSLRLVVSVLKQAISLAPDQATYRFAMAKLLLESGDQTAAFEWIRELSARHLHQMTCRCCLERLAGMYESMHDRIRAHACRVVIATLPDMPTTTVTANRYLLANEYNSSLNSLDARLHSQH